MQYKKLSLIVFSEGSGRLQVDLSSQETPLKVVVGSLAMRKPWSWSQELPGWCPLLLLLLYQQHGKDLVRRGGDPKLLHYILS